MLLPRVFITFACEWFGALLRSVLDLKYGGAIYKG